MITVEENVQIGRGRGERRDPTRWYTDRSKPQDFADLALLIDIDGSPYMSRNHAGIRRQGETYTVQDLNSLNGTHRNGVRIEPGMHYPLAVGDEIRMGLDVLSVSESPDAFANARGAGDAFASLRAPEWYLGVAGYGEDAHARRTFYGSVTRVARELNARGYQTEVHGVKPEDLPVSRSRAIEAIQLPAILDSLNRRACAADSRSHTFFQYSGHGTRDGLVVSGMELLRPRTLFVAVASIRGKKLLVLDACHAGVFLSDPAQVPPQTTILAATRSADAVAYADGPDATVNQVDGPMTNLSRRLWELLRGRRDAFNMLDERSALEAAFRQDDDGVVYVQEPGMNTVTFTVCLKSVCLSAVHPAVAERLVQEQREARGTSTHRG